MMTCWRPAATPITLKQRIRGGKGHLSNKQALAFITTHRPAHMTHLLLSHLSKNNNDPKTGRRFVHQLCRWRHIIVASRHEETPVYYIMETKVKRWKF
jgi:hypothetical protein